MKALTKFAIAMAAVSLLPGCASGGGSGEGVWEVSYAPAPPPPDTPCGLPVCVPYLPFGGERSSEPFSPPPPPYTPKASFTSWPELLPDTHTAVDSSVDASVSYKTTRERVWSPATPNAPEQWRQGLISSTTIWPEPELGGANVRYDTEGKPTFFSPLQAAPHFYVSMGSAGGLGQSGVDVIAAINADAWSGNYPRNPFLNAGWATVHFALVANPYAAGWDYQSFGVWDVNGWEGGWIRAASFGSPTPGSSVPTSGTASFAGKLAGFYVSPTGQAFTAGADLDVAADFRSRTLGLASTRTTMVSRDAASQAAPHLNLTGTLTYSPGSNSFSGPLSNPGGTMSGTSKGQFYGPAAQELGGAFSVKSATTVETFSGAYGAKR
jgi:hypothetical protein